MLTSVGVLEVKFLNRFTANFTPFILSFPVNSKGDRRNKICNILVFCLSASDSEAVFNNNSVSRFRGRGKSI